MTTVCLVVNPASHLDLVEKVLIGSFTVLLEKLHHNLAHVDLLLHQREDGCILLTWLHQDVIGKSWI